MSGAIEEPSCKYCGSRDVSKDAVVKWDSNNQKWDISDILDSGNCNRCGAEKHCVEWVRQ